MSSFLALANAVKDLLLQAPALASGFVHVGRAFPLPAEHDQGIFVRAARASGATPMVGDSRTDWATEIVIVMGARAAAGGNGLEAADALLDAVYASLAGAAPPEQSDGWVLQPVLAWDVDEADTTLGAAELRLRINHRTAAGSLAAAA